MKSYLSLALLFAIAQSFVFAQTSAAATYRYEAENATLFGTAVSSSFPGYSGSGYVTDFNAPDGSDRFQLNVDVPEGRYELWIGYRSQYGDKGYYYNIDGSTGSGTFDQSFFFTEDRAGIFDLSAGINTLEISQFWGYYDVDYLEFRSHTPTELLPVSRALVDSQADLNTQWLRNYMNDIYGSKTMFGLQHNGSKNLAFPVQDFVNMAGGYTPAIRCADFIEYSPSRLAYGSTPDNESEQAIAWAQQTGGVVSMSWHWNAPTDLINEPDKEWWRGFYTYATTFDVAAALANPAGEDYALLLRDIDAIASELQKFEDAGVPVIWRPLHEAQGGWFWWGAQGPDAFKELWSLMYDRMTNHHGLHNLIWEFTSSAAEGDYLDWYPGDDVVDIVSVDIYTDPESAMSGQWADLLDQYNGNKMLTLSETGTLPDPDQMDMWAIDWGYISTWTWDHILNTYADAGYSTAQLQAILQNFLSHEDIITLDELPTTPWLQTLPGDLDADGFVGLTDLDLILQYWNQTTNAQNLLADPSGDGFIGLDDLDIVLANWNTGTPPITTVPEPTTMSLLAISLAAACRRSRPYTH